MHPQAHTHVHTYICTHKLIDKHMHTQARTHTHTQGPPAPPAGSPLLPARGAGFSVSGPSQYSPAQSGAPGSRDTPTGNTVRARPAHARVGTPRQWRGNALPATSPRPARFQGHGQATGSRWGGGRPRPSRESVSRAARRHAQACAVISHPLASLRAPGQRPAGPAAEQALRVGGQSGLRARWASGGLCCVPDHLLIPCPVRARP